MWLNALSVKNGYKPVYYLDADFKKPVFDSRKISNGSVKTDINGVPATDRDGNPIYVYDYTIKNFHADLTANGYRIPTLPEWQYAGQGALRTAKDKNYVYAGSSKVKEVASIGKMRIPGQYKPNGLGIYDMSGNVAEFTLTGNEMNFYGGHYQSSFNEIYSVIKPYALSNAFPVYPYLFGFRIAQTIK